MSDGAEQESRRAELELVRWTLTRAGLERDDEELERLLPWFRIHRESGARISDLPLAGSEPRIVFDPRWSD